MAFWDALGQEGAEGRTLWVLAVFLVSVTLVRAFSTQRSRLKSLTFLVIVHLVCWLIAAASRALGGEIHHDFHVTGSVAGGIAVVGSIAAVLFSVALPRVRLETPRILQDVIVAGAALVTAVTVASRAGVNLSGLIATSAVFTAVLGFSLQDVIGNVAGGLALQVDNSIGVGDWIKVGDVQGKVTEIRWRHTAVETRNWETVLVPNSVLMKSQVQVLGRHGGVPKPWRRWVTFNVDWRYPPTDVIDCVVAALKNARLERVAGDPAPNVVLTELSESFGRYAVRYWLTDMQSTDATDSEVRTVIYFALQRAGMRLSIPAHAVFVTEESADRAEGKTRLQLERRVRLLDRLDLFKDLKPEEKLQLARGLRHTPFAHGEVMTRQGAEAHWLYVLEEGEAAVRVGEGGVEKEVARLTGPTFFGEMSLMTGEPRAATVVAVTDTECFRLEKSTFREVLKERPALAEQIAEVLTRRRAELLAVREGVTAAAKLKQMRGSETALLEKIRGFFGLID
ncbi:MAG: mechanosensitive ion channel family protein [Archangiaceae bacterium]|nr:mechanosensitive ion channel family protein [Archangiaceae bacterium]